jgi:hypothetical protein
MIHTSAIAFLLDMTMEIFDSYTIRNADLSIQERTEIFFHIIERK